MLVLSLCLKALNLRKADGLMPHCNHSDYTFASQHIISIA